MKVSISFSVPTNTPAVNPSPRVLEIAGMFGLGVDDGPDFRGRNHVVVPPMKLDLRGGEILFITGPSGSGKSSILRLIEQEARQLSPPSAICDLQSAIPSPATLPGATVVDCFPDLPLDEAMGVLSVAGLNDAFVMMRTPAELSDGQRWRLKLALAMAGVSFKSRVGAAEPLLRPSGSESGNDQLPETRNSKLETLILADEFASTLDRLTAMVIARNVRKWVTARPDVCFIAATTHDDLLEPLQPDVLIYKHLGQRVEVMRRTSADRLAFTVHR